MFCRTIFSAVRAFALFGTFCVAWTPQSFAQRAESFPFSGEHVGAVDGTVTGSQGNAITSLQNDVLDAAILGLAAPQSGGSVGAGVFPIGRLRQTYHDGYKSVDGVTFASPAFSTSEGSAFGTLFFRTPPSAGGGQLQLGAFAGYDSLFMRLSASPNYSEQITGKASNEAFMYGGYGLYTLGSSYLMLTLSGAEGQTDLSTSGGTRHWDGASYDTHGFIGNLTGGHVVDLSPASSRSPVRLDLRAGVSYQNMTGDPFRGYYPLETFSASLDTWNGSLSGTLFSQIPVSGGGVWRPFLKGEVRQQLSYDNTVTRTNAGASNEFKFDQEDTTGALEVGMDYIIKGVTFNAAAYGELSGDRETYGGRVGAKFTFP